MYTQFCASYVDSPIGLIEVLATSEGVFQAAYVSRKDVKRMENDFSVLGARQLSEYFEGARQQFDLPIAVLGSAMQRKARYAALEIPFGHTDTYQGIADVIAKSKAVGSVERALELNPLYIIVPCHRVLGTNGALGSYGGGPDRKKWLLAHEGIAL